MGEDCSGHAFKSRTEASASRPSESERLLDAIIGRRDEGRVCREEPSASLDRRHLSMNSTATVREQSRAATAFERLERATDIPLAFLALLIVPALILEERAQSPWLR